MTPVQEKQVYRSRNRRRHGHGGLAAAIAVAVICAVTLGVLQTKAAPARRAAGAVSATESAVETKLDALAPAAKTETKIVVAIDPGHGGSDTGAVGPTGVTEASVTLAVSKDLQSILENSGARVTMTRNKDVDVYGPNASDRQELQARVNVGEYTPGAELFVSIHCNAFSNPASHGMETYYYAGSPRGERIATLVNEAVPYTHLTLPTNHPV